MGVAHVTEAPEAAPADTVISLPHTRFGGVVSGRVKGDGHIISLLDTRLLVLTCSINFIIWEHYTRSRSSPNSNPNSKSGSIVNCLVVATPTPKLSPKSRSSSGTM